jgi:hypothetical protein
LETSRVTAKGWQSAGPLATHGLLDEPHDDHQDASADAARGNLANDGPDIETTSTRRRLRAATDQLTDDLRSDTATYYPGDGVADNAKVKLLEQRSSDISADPSSDQLYNQPNYSTPHDASS